MVLPVVGGFAEFPIWLILTACWLSAKEFPMTRAPVIRPPVPSAPTNSTGKSMSEKMLSRTVSRGSFRRCPPPGNEDAVSAVGEVGAPNMRERVAGHGHVATDAPQ